MGTNKYNERGHKIRFCKKKKSYYKMKWYSLCVQHYSVCSAYFQRFYFLDKNGKLHSYYYIFYYIHISIEYRYLHNYITCPKLQNTYVPNFFCWNYWRCSIFLLEYLGSGYTSFVFLIHFYKLEVRIRNTYWHNTEKWE